MNALEKHLKKQRIAPHVDKIILRHYDYDKEANTVMLEVLLISSNMSSELCSLVCPLIVLSVPVCLKRNRQENHRPSKDEIS